MQNTWTPIKYREMTSEEIAEWGTIEGTLIIDSPMPDDCEVVLVTLYNGFVGIDIYHDDAGDCYFEDYSYMGDIKAWMSLPEPYKEDDDDRIDH